jgi:hypothetical protein
MLFRLEVYIGCKVENCDRGSPLPEHHGKVNAHQATVNRGGYRIGKVVLLPERRRPGL